MASSLKTGSIAPGSSPGRGQRVVSLTKTQTHTMPVYKWISANFKY